MKRKGCPLRAGYVKKALALRKQKHKLKPEWRAPFARVLSLAVRSARQGAPYCNSARSDLRYAEKILKKHKK